MIDKQNDNGNSKNPKGQASICPSSTMARGTFEPVESGYTIWKVFVAQSSTIKYIPYSG